MYIYTSFNIYLNDFHIIKNSLSPSSCDCGTLSLSLMDSGTLSLIELMLFVYKGYCILHLHHIIYLLKMCAALTTNFSFIAYK